MIRLRRSKRPLSAMTEGALFLYYSEAEKAHLSVARLISACFILNICVA